MTSREQVADLQPEDVVEITSPTQPGFLTRGPLVADGYGGLRVGVMLVRTIAGEVGITLERDGYDLTVVSRAPRPLYVNHSRTEPTCGDTANPSDGTSSVAFRTATGWIWPNGTSARPGEHGLRLLVDGETGQVVP
jgi:hypothetical protein